MTSPVKLWRNKENTQKLLGKRGVILTWSIVRTPPEGFEAGAPYAVAIVEFEDASKMVAEVVSGPLDAISIGKQVVAVIRKIGEPEKADVIQYGIKVKLVPTNS